MGFVLVLVGVLFGTIRAQFLPQDGNVPQLLPLAPVQTSRLPQVEVDALLDIAAQLEPTAINTQTAVATWTNGTNPCNWIGVYCNCSATVYDPNLVACPPNSDGDHVYALDLSWRSNYRGNGWSPMQGTISPAVGALKELRYFAIRNNMISGHLPDAALQLLEQLGAIDVANNNISGSLPIFVATLPHLRQAWLNINSLRGRIPEEWCARFAAESNFSLVVNIVDNPQVCAVASSCLAALTQTVGAGNVFQNTWVGDSMTIFNNNYEGQAIKMPEFWTQFTQVEFAFSNWTLPSYPGQDTSLTNPIFYEFRATDTYAGKLLETGGQCSYYLGSFATNGTAADYTLDSDADPTEGGFMVTVGPLYNNAYLNATAAGLGNSTNNGRQWVVRVTAVNSQCTSRQATLVSASTMVVTSPPTPSVIYNTPNLVYTPIQLNATYMGVSFEQWTDLPAVDCCVYEATVIDAFTSRPVSEKTRVPKNKSGFYQALIPANMTQGGSYYVQVTGVNKAKLTASAESKILRIDDDSSDDTTSTAILAIAIALGVGIPLILLMGITFATLMHRMRMQALAQERRRQQLIMFRDVLDTVRHHVRRSKTGGGGGEVMGGVFGKEFEGLKEVVLVVTDLEASTAAAKANPQAYQQVQLSHDQTLRESIAMHNGYEVSTQGDSFFVVFPRVADAVQWSMAVQWRLLQTNWPKAVYRLPACNKEYSHDGELMFAGPRVRIGIHYATPGTFAYRLNTDGSLSITGMAYKYTEALSDAGAGGQVLLSHTAWQQLRGVEGCPCGGFPVMQQLGLFQLDGPFSPDWVYEVKYLLGNPLHRTFHSIDGQPLRKATCLRPGRMLHVTHPPTPEGEDKALVFVVAMLRLPTTEHHHQLTSPASLVKRVFRPIDHLLHRVAAKAVPGARGFRRALTASSLGVVSGVGGGGGVVVSEQPTPRNGDVSKKSILTNVEQTVDQTVDQDEQQGVHTHDVSTKPTHLTNKDGPTNLQQHHDDVDLEKNTTTDIPEGSNSQQSPARKISTGRSLRHKPSTAASSQHDGQQHDYQQHDGQTRQHSAALLGVRNSWKTMLLGSRKSVRADVPAWALLQTVDMLVASATQFGGYATSTGFQDHNNTMLFAFTDEADAVHFCHTAQLALLYSDWGCHPGRSHDVFGPTVQVADGRVVFAGPRVAMAVHRGGDYRTITTHDPVLINTTTYWPADVDYQGGTVDESYALARALHGGQVVLTQSAWIRLQGLLPPSSVSLSLGVYAIPGYYTPTVHDEAAALTQPDTLRSGLLIQLMPQVLAMRVFPPLAEGQLTSRQLTKGFFDSPDPLGNVAICFIKVSMPTEVESAMATASHHDGAAENNDNHDTNHDNHDNNNTNGGSNHINDTTTTPTHTVTTPTHTGTNTTPHVSVNDQQSTQSTKSITNMDNVVNVLTDYYAGLFLADTLVRRLLPLFDGYECKSPEKGKFTLAWSNLQQALYFCTTLQQQLLTLPWPPGMLQWDTCAPVHDGNTGVLLWRGLRVQCGVTWGVPMQRKPLSSGHADYYGTQANLAARLMSSASPGQILVQHTVDLEQCTQPLPPSFPLSNSLPSHLSSDGGGSGGNDGGGGVGYESGVDGSSMEVVSEPSAASFSLPLTMSSAGGTGTGTGQHGQHGQHGQRVLCGSLTNNAHAAGMTRSSPTTNASPPTNAGDDVVYSNQHGNTTHTPMPTMSSGLQSSLTSSVCRIPNTLKNINSSITAVGRLGSGGGWVGGVGQRRGGGKEVGGGVRFLGPAPEDAGAVWVQVVGRIHLKGLDSSYMIASAQGFPLHTRAFPPLPVVGEAGGWLHQQTPPLLSTLRKRKHTRARLRKHNTWTCMDSSMQPTLSTSTHTSPSFQYPHHHHSTTCTWEEGVHSSNNSLWNVAGSFPNTTRLRAVDRSDPSMMRVDEGGWDVGVGDRGVGHDDDDARKQGNNVVYRHWKTRSGGSGGFSGGGGSGGGGGGGGAGAPSPHVGVPFPNNTHGQGIPPMAKSPFAEVVADTFGSDEEDGVDVHVHDVNSQLDVHGQLDEKTQEREAAQHDDHAQTTQHVAAHNSWRHRAVGGPGTMLAAVSMRSVRSLHTPRDSGSVAADHGESGGEASVMVGGDEEGTGGNDNHQYQQQHVGGFNGVNPQQGQQGAVSVMQLAEQVCNGIQLDENELQAARDMAQLYVRHTHFQPM